MSPKLFLDLKISQNKKTAKTAKNSPKTRKHVAYTNQKRAENTNKQLANLTNKLDQ